MQLLIKTVKLKVENSAQTTFRFSPIKYRIPRSEIRQWFQLKLPEGDRRRHLFVGRSRRRRLKRRQLLQRQRRRFFDDDDLR